MTDTLDIGEKVHICGYGCGQIARYPPRNGMKKWCCSDKFQNCEFLKSARLKTLKDNGYTCTFDQKYHENHLASIINMGRKLNDNENYICQYGCNQKAKFQFKNGKYCCSNRTSKCESKRLKKKIWTKNYIKSYELKEDDYHICEYGCQQKAHYKIRNGKYCCASNQHECRHQIEKDVLTRQKIRPLENNVDYLCDFGCNQLANYVYDNGKYCCSSHYNKCVFIRKKKKGKKLSPEVHQKIAYNNTYTLKDFFKVYPMLEKLEEFKELENKVILVHCKNSKCKNSKENGGWFQPKRSAIIDRGVSLNQDIDGCYFYCCEECKKECPVYGRKTSDLINGIKNRKERSFTDQEYTTWRLTVLTRDNHICHYCHGPANTAHHIVPVKMNPVLALDPDNGLSVCTRCHYDYCHKGEGCSTGYLANLVCTTTIEKSIK